MITTALMRTLLLLGAASLCVGDCGSPEANNAVLALTNQQRALHGSPPLVWNRTLESRVQFFVNGCPNTHSDDNANKDDDNTPNTAENMSFDQSLDATCLVGASDFYGEVADVNYNFALVGFQSNVAHFYGVVWRQARSMACGVKTCTNLKPPGGTAGTWRVFACRYYPWFLCGAGEDCSEAAQLARNVRRTACQTSTKQDTCKECEGSLCTKCYECKACTLKAPVTARKPPPPSSGSPAAAMAKRCMSTSNGKRFLQAISNKARPFTGSRVLKLSCPFPKKINVNCLFYGHLASGCLGCSSALGLRKVQATCNGHSKCNIVVRHDSNSAMLCSALRLTNCRRICTMNPCVGKTETGIINWTCK